jgi:hypothetical protein
MEVGFVAMLRIAVTASVPRRSLRAPTMMS